MTYFYMGRLCKAENQKAESQKAEVKRQKIKWQKNQTAGKTKGRKSVGRKSKGIGYWTIIRQFVNRYCLSIKRARGTNHSCRK